MQGKYIKLKYVNIVLKETEFKINKKYLCKFPTFFDLQALLHYNKNVWSITLNFVKSNLCHYF